MRLSISRTTPQGHNNLDIDRSHALTIWRLERFGLHVDCLSDENYGEAPQKVFKEEKRKDNDNTLEKIDKEGVWRSTMKIPTGGGKRLKLVTKASVSREWEIGWILKERSRLRLVGLLSKTPLPFEIAWMKAVTSWVLKAKEEPKYQRRVRLKGERDFQSGRSKFGKQWENLGRFGQLFYFWDDPSFPVSNFWRGVE